MSGSGYAPPIGRRTGALASATLPRGGSARGRLAAFAALAVLAAIHWGSLIAEPQGARFLGVVVVAVGGAWLLIRLEGRIPSKRRARLVAATVGLGVALAGLVLLGVPLSRLLPWGWNELGADVDGGLRTLSGRIDYPFDGSNAWAGILLVAALPVLLGLATAIGFRPGREAGPRFGALSVMVAAVAIPVASRPADGQLFWGLLLTLAIAAWLWAPRLRGPGLGAVLATALVAIPLAAAWRTDSPWIDYRDWQIDRPGDGAHFAWDHSYGPIDWERDGSGMFRVRSDEPHYWRVDALDEFDGVRWKRSIDGGLPVPGELPERIGPNLKGRWVEQVDVSVSGLRGHLVPAPGTALAVDGLTRPRRARDGVVSAGGRGVVDDSEYSVTAYVPSPGARQMRRTSRSYPTTVSDYTELTLPPFEDQAGPVPVGVPPRGQPPSAATEDAIANSAYGRVYDLATELTATSSNGYDAAVAIERYLKDNYSYSENPTLRPLPLDAFLFEDEVGYCQQFSGAMALMLRMTGVPARVASGFAPGNDSVDQPGTFEVTDLDAHSWVEVYFDGIGWVPFDPTPPSAPAALQADATLPGGSEFGFGPRSESDPTANADQNAKADRGTPFGDAGSSASAGDGGVPVGRIALLTLGVTLLGGLAAIAVRSARHRSLASERNAELSMRELGPALRAAGWLTGRGATLTVLERRLAGAGNRVTASYVARLRAHRYESGGAPELVTAADRRASRRELSRRKGLRERLRVWVAMPPGGPRR